MATTVSAAKAKAEFAECMRKAEAGDPVVITRHGKAVVALVRADRLQQLERLGSAGPAAGLAGLVGGWRGSEELVRLLTESRRTKARRVPGPGREPMAYLFDTDAISEVLKPRPAAGYARWLATVPREEQFTSAVVVGELYKGAFRSSAAARHLENVEKRVLPAVTVLSYDVAAARVYGQVRARLESAGRPLADADLQIAATALLHDLELVTGNVKHFKRVPGLRISPMLAEARSRS